MPRIARVVVIGVPHHITQRASNGQYVFLTDEDHRRYLRVLKEQSQKYELKIFGYCLMSNHIHLVATPLNEHALAKTMGRTNLSYTMYFNRVHDRNGHLWQNRFYSCPLDERHFWASMRYVERNPVEAGLVRCAWRYPWSSAAAHVLGEDAAGLLDLEEWKAEMRPKDWSETLKHPERPENVTKLGKALSTGRPLGSNGFVSDLEKMLNRRLRALPGGRPRKNEN